MTAITKCRICGGSNLVPVLSLGEQALTGVFPCSKDAKVSKGPLDLVWCSSCGLLQLGTSYNLAEMYGENYGYRSGLNLSMVKHLTSKVRMLEQLADLKTSDTVIDIGSNDATLLKAYSVQCHKLGIDPTATKFKQYYPREIGYISDFFTADTYHAMFDGCDAKIVTSIAMFYDLENPTAFVRDIHEVLADDGIWHFEQSYMPSMIRSTAYDTICHEHLEFYSFAIVKSLLEKCGLRVVDVQMNAINGGSFAVTACKTNAKYVSNKPVIDWMLRQEKNLLLDTPKPYRDFEERVYHHRTNLLDLLTSLHDDGKIVFGYGASTKGNVLLQFCGITNKLIPYIADVNFDKIGCVTPGTHIPIITEESARAMKPDYFLVLPWHFKHTILEKESDYIKNGGKFIFPLPEIEIV